MRIHLLQYLDGGTPEPQIFQSYLKLTFLVFHLLHSIGLEFSSSKFKLDDFHNISCTNRSLFFLPSVLYFFVPSFHSLFPFFHFFFPPSFVPSVYLPTFLPMMVVSLENTNEFIIFISKYNSSSTGLSQKFWRVFDSFLLFYLLPIIIYNKF